MYTIFSYLPRKIPHLSRLNRSMAKSRRLRSGMVSFIHSCPYLLTSSTFPIQLLPVEQVITKMRQGLFKPNCALGMYGVSHSFFQPHQLLFHPWLWTFPVLIDFFIRHGYITPESEPYYMEILTRWFGFHLIMDSELIINTPTCKGCTAGSITTSGDTLREPEVRPCRIWDQLAASACQKGGTCDVRTQGA